MSIIPYVIEQTSRGERSYLYIDCLWVSGSMKGHGYSNDLLEACIRDAKAQGKKGICILCAEGRKREFLADPKFLAYKGFRVADISDCGINLMYLSIEPTAQMPKFRECAKHPAIEDNGFVLYYTDQCPYHCRARSITPIWRRFRRPADLSLEMKLRLLLQMEAASKAGKPASTRRCCS